MATERGLSEYLLTVALSTHGEWIRPFPPHQCTVMASARRMSTEPVSLEPITSEENILDIWSGESSASTGQNLAIVTTNSQELITLRNQRVGGVGRVRTKHRAYN